MFDYVRYIKEESLTLAKLINSDNGKTIADAKGDVFRG